MTRVRVEEARPSGAELVELYGDVGWTAYTDDPERLERAIRASHLVLAARDADDRLVGLARTISDGETITYLQDILVASAHRRRGIGALLLDEVLERTQAIRQFVLVTDAEAGRRAFYESRGLVEVHDARPELRAFALMR